MGPADRRLRAAALRLLEDEPASRSKLAPTGDGGPGALLPRPADYHRPTRKKHEVPQAHTELSRPFPSAGLRYIGTMVADVHRTLLYGGVFFYPAQPPTMPHGKLSLVFEAAPMAFLAHHAGAHESCGTGGSLLDLAPSSTQQRTPVVIGSRDDCERLGKG